MHTLQDLENGTLTGARQVRLTHLGLTTFPSQLLDLADTLEVLDLSGNQLTSLPDDFARLTQLRIVFASNNPFTVLPSVLGQCPQLEMVGFKACRITHVPEDSLPARLQKLMLSCNQLTALPNLSACPHLELLALPATSSRTFRLACCNCPPLPATPSRKKVSYQRLPALRKWQFLIETWK